MLSAGGVDAVTIVGGCVEIDTTADVTASTITAVEGLGRSVAVGMD